MRDWLHRALFVTQHRRLSIQPPISAATGDIEDSRILGNTTADETEKWEKVVKFARARLE
jgi:hypothetical protein